MILESIAGFSLIGFAGSNALETALMTLSLSQEKRLVARLERKGYSERLTLWYRQAFRDWKRHPLAFLMAILIFNTAFSMLWCIAGLNKLGYTAWAPLVVGFMLFIAGELFPKVVARRFPDSVLLVVLLPFYFLFSLTRKSFSPLAGYFESVTHWHMPKWMHYPMTEKEVRHILSDAELTQDLRPRSRLILETMMGFSKRRIKQAMIGKEEVFYVSLTDAQSPALIQRILDSGFSRIPVSADGSFDNIVGLLYVKDLMFTYATSGLVNLQDLMRECPVLEETQELGPILAKLREGGIHIALVRNKNGQATGIISLEDVIEELVGEIQDEFS